MAPSCYLSLAEGCHLAEGAAGAVLTTPRGELDLAGLPQVLADVVRRLLPGVSEAELAGIGGLDVLLSELHTRLVLCRSVRAGGAALLTARPLSSACPFALGGAGEDRRWVLSRFALLRRIGERLVLESPRSRWRVTVHGRRGAALVAELRRPLGAAELAAALAGADAEAAASLALGLLGGAGILAAVDERGTTDEEHAALRQWQFHDLLFHARSRQGRHAGGYGASGRFHGKAAALPALKPDMPGEVVELHRPDLRQVAGSDPPLTRVLEQRRSVREHGEPPIALRQLGEFLYRSARVRETTGIGDHEVARRVYPGGGAAYELEVYLAVGRCRGLEPGLYHYRPAAHQLVRIAGFGAEVERLLRSGRGAARMQSPAQVLVLLSARFRRLSRTYASVAYAMVLKDVGVVMQTMYLVATAMGLAACAVGGGDSDLFARAADLDYYEETSVGELLLGSRAPGGVG